MSAAQYIQVRTGNRVLVTSSVVRIEGSTHTSNPHIPAKRWYVVARPKDTAAYAAKKVKSGEWRPA